MMYNLKNRGNNKKK